MGGAGAPADNRPAVVQEQKLDIETEPAVADEVAMLMARWKEISEKVSKIAQSARGILPDVRPVRVEKDRVFLAFDPEFADEAERFHDVRMKKGLEHVLGALLNREVTVAITVAAEAPGNRATPVVARPAPGKAPEDKAEKGKKGRSRQEIIDDPAVQKALDIFGGTIVDVRE